MALRAVTTRRAFWSRRESYVYEGTYLELWPEAASGYWLVVDVRKDLKAAGPFQRLNQAKVAAERLVDRDPGYRRETDG